MKIKRKSKKTDDSTSNKFKVSHVANAALLSNAGRKAISPTSLMNPFLATRNIAKSTTDLSGIYGNYKGVNHTNEHLNYRKGKEKAKDSAGHVGAVTGAIKGATTGLVTGVPESAALGTAMNTGRYLYKGLKGSDLTLKGLGKAALKGTGYGLLASPIASPILGALEGREEARIKAGMAYDRSIKTSGDLSKLEMGKFQHGKTEAALGAGGLYGAYRLAKGNKKLGGALMAGSALAYGGKRYLETLQDKKFMARKSAVVDKSNPDKNKSTGAIGSHALIGGTVAGLGMIVPESVKLSNRLNNIDIKEQLLHFKNHDSYASNWNNTLDNYRGKVSNMNLDDWMKSRDALRAERDAALNKLDDLKNSRTKLIENSAKKAKKSVKFKSGKKIATAMAIGSTIGAGLGYLKDKAYKSKTDTERQAKTGFINGAVGTAIPAAGLNLGGAWTANKLGNKLLKRKSTKPFLKTGWGKAAMIGTAATSLLGGTLGAGEGAIRGKVTDLEKKLNSKNNKK